MNIQEELKQLQAENAALRVANRTILEHINFNEAAKAIFDTCKDLIGATSGYVALSSKDKSQNEVLFVDSGGFTCSVDPSLPMPIRGLRSEVYQTRKAIYDNNFSKSKYWKLIPEGHAILENVLFAPLMVEDKVVGLLGFGNKDGGFTKDDVKIAIIFSKIVSASLINSRLQETLKFHEKNYESMFSSSIDAIITSDSNGIILNWNPRAETIFGYTAKEAVGKPLTIIIPEHLRKAHQDGIDRVRITGKTKIVGKTVEVAALRKDGSEFPADLSLSGWKVGEERYFAATIRDISRLKLNEERYTTILNTSLDGFWLTDYKGIFLDVNDTYSKLIGYSRDELLNMKISDIELVEKPEDTARHIEKLIKTGYERFETKHRCKDGSIVDIEISANYTNIQNGLFFVFLRDITKHKQNEEELRKHHENLEELVKERTIDLQKNYDTHSVVNTLMNLSLENVPTEKLLGRALELILSISWLAFRSSGCITLVEDEPEVLVMKAQKGLSKQINKLCARIPIGWCICGRAALTQKIEFADCVDEHHDTRYKGMLPHGHYCVPIIYSGRTLGVLNMYLKEGHILTQREEDFLTTVANTLAGVLIRRHAEESLEHSYEKLEKTLEGTITALTTAVEQRDPYTAGHQQRVTQFACAIAKEMGLLEDRIKAIRVAGLLHDIGKLHVPAEILAKPGKLTGAEYELIKCHAQIGYEILKTVAFSGPVAEIVLEHHERMDGSGYPKGLSGDDILLESRILGVSDVVEAMSSHRPYRPAIGMDGALLEILRNKGTLYDSNVVDVCVDLITTKRFRF